MTPDRIALIIAVIVFAVALCGIAISVFDKTDD